MNNVQTAITAIRGMTNNEINQVVEAIKLQRTYNARSVARELNVGDTVSFTGKRGTVVGTVEKINTKTVLVNSPSAGRWKVTASMLTTLGA
jgi:FKBP-type peptidyl-prolyl cis-trans isomerase 2